MKKIITLILALTMILGMTSVLASCTGGNDNGSDPVVKVVDVKLTDEEYAFVIKKDNNRESYDRSKIEGGILRACHKRPIALKEINALIDAVESEIFNREEREIESSKIGEIVMDKLKGLDSVAYVRFASVYREFKDVNTFMDELKKMLEK